MKPSVIQVILVVFSYSELISAVRHYDPFEEFLMRERLQQEEYNRQQEELRIRFEQQQQEQLERLQRLYSHEFAADNGSGLPPTSMETSTDVTTEVDMDTATMPPTTTTTTSEQPTTTGSPRMQRTCCALGEKSARSGFLCTPENYRPQFFMDHDMYRQSNFKISRSQREQYVEQRQFSKCVSGAVPALSDEFQRCCKRAYVDTLDEEVVGVSREEDEMPIMLELPLQIDIISKQRKRPRTHRKVKV